MYAYYIDVGQKIDLSEVSKTLDKLRKKYESIERSKNAANAKSSTKNI